MQTIQQNVNTKSSPRDDLPKIINNANIEKTQISAASINHIMSAGLVDNPEIKRNKQKMDNLLHGKNSKNNVISSKINNDQSSNSKTNNLNLNVKDAFEKMAKSVAPVENINNPKPRKRSSDSNTSNSLNSNFNNNGPIVRAPINGSADEKGFKNVTVVPSKEGVRLALSNSGSSHSVNFGEANGAFQNLVSNAAVSLGSSRGASRGQSPVVINGMPQGVNQLFNQVGGQNGQQQPKKEKSVSSKKLINKEPKAEDPSRPRSGSKKYSKGNKGFAPNFGMKK